MDNHVQIHGLFKFRSMTEAVNEVCDDALDDHVWRSELTIACQEAKVLQCDLANPCIVQWRKLWNKSVSLALVATLTLLSLGCTHQEFKIDAYCSVQVTTETLEREQNYEVLETGGEA